MDQTELVRRELDRLKLDWTAYPYNPRMVTKVGNWYITECMGGKHLQAYINNLEPEEVATITTALDSTSFGGTTITTGGVWMEFAERLRNTIGESGMTQSELAVACGVTGATISRYANGKRKPDVEMLSRLKTALGCTYDKLMEDGKENDGD